MSVQIILAEENGGDEITSIFDAGDGGNGDTSTPQTYFISHDGNSKISAVKVFFRRKTGVYTGRLSPTDDWEEFLRWGDSESVDGFGGIQINFDAANSFTTWPTLESKTNGDSYTVRTGIGDSADNAITIPVVSGASVAGEVPTGESPDISFQVRVVVPNNIEITGERQFDIAIEYDFTS